MSAANHTFLLAMPIHNTYSRPFAQPFLPMHTSRQVHVSDRPAECMHDTDQNLMALQLKLRHNM